MAILEYRKPVQVDPKLVEMVDEAFKPRTRCKWISKPVKIGTFLLALMAGLFMAGLALGTSALAVPILYALVAILAAPFILIMLLTFMFSSGVHCPGCPFH